MTLNRTILELKPANEGQGGQGQRPLNRTILELKHENAEPTRKAETGS